MFTIDPDYGTLIKLDPLTRTQLSIPVKCSMRVLSDTKGPEARGSPTSDSRMHVPVSVCMYSTVLWHAYKHPHTSIWHIYIYIHICAYARVYM